MGARRPAMGALAVALGALVFGVGFRLVPGQSVAGVAARAPAGAARAPRVAPLVPPSGPAARTPSPPPSPVALPLPAPDRRLARAEQTLAAYQLSARYPPSCRPIAERPDLADPRAGSARRLPL